MTVSIIISTYPNKKALTKLGNDLVTSRIAACVNISKITSIYSWNHKVVNTPEYLAMFKTTTKNKTALKRKIKDTHPYDVPEILEINITTLNKPYLDWITQSTI